MGPLDTALKFWTQYRRGNLVRLAARIWKDSDVDEVVREITLSLVDRHHRAALSWLVHKIVEAGNRLDEALTWEFIKNGRVRDFFEDHDNAGDKLITAINALSDTIRADCEAVRDRTPEDVAASVCLDLLGGRGRALDFFNAPRLRGPGQTFAAGDYPGLPGLRPSDRPAPVDVTPAPEATPAPDPIETVEAPEAPPEATPAPVVVASEPPPAPLATLGPPPEPGPRPTAAERLRSAMRADEAEANSPGRTSPTASRRVRRRRTQ